MAELQGLGRGGSRGGQARGTRGHQNRKAKSRQRCGATGSTSTCRGTGAAYPTADQATERPRAE
eukprot:10842889-Lingulodinium_polyedra.AAC.1